jgi:hypothetical protein
MSCKDNKKVSGCLSRHPEIVEKDRVSPVYGYGLMASGPIS